MDSMNVIWKDPISKSIYFRSDLRCEALIVEAANIWMEENLVWMIKIL
jgi:hypothetical protein